VRQGEAQYKAECNAAVADLQACTVKWLSYFGQLYSVRLAALSAPAPASLNCRTVLADWPSGHFFSRHPQLTWTEGVAMAKECTERHPAAARPTVPASYPPPTPALSENHTVRITGEITEATITQFDVSILGDVNINAVVLDSPGGHVIASRDLALRIRRLHLTTLVPANAECASACFMLFAAGTQRIAGATARIGVHSAALDGEETGVTLAMSTLMARQCGAFGVPPAILGKMVTKAPDDMAWLSADELRSMQVVVE
jgi:membrane-bound ClpP family serine protease